MKKILDFLKTNFVIVKWTIGYIFTVWFILKFLFKFDMFSGYYWWKFFHANLHGFAGFVFSILIYSMIPLYIATTVIVYQKKESIITIPFVDKIKTFITSKFTKQEKVEQETTSEEQKPEEEPVSPYPEDLPSELRVPFMRAKNHLSLSGAMSVYNKPKEIKQNTPQEIMENNTNNIPLPTDFDISSENTDNDDFIPTFTDIDFDEPDEPVLENNTTKYFESKNIEYETYKNYVATEKYLIYEHNDTDFWIMDENTWFAAGKQIDSPTNELLEVAKQNDLTPVIYLDSQNIMDLESVISGFEKLGIKTVKNLDELN